MSLTPYNIKKKSTFCLCLQDFALRALTLPCIHAHTQTVKEIEKNNHIYYCIIKSYSRRLGRLYIQLAI